MRESVKNSGKEYHKARHYVAYYRNKNFYANGAFKEFFVGKTRSHSYILYHTRKFFNTFAELKNKFLQDPLLMEKYSKNFPLHEQRSQYIYAYKKKKNE